MWIRFTSAARSRGTCPEDSEFFEAGQVADLRADQAERWLRRNLAVACDPPEPEPATEPDPEPATEPAGDDPVPRRQRRPRG